MSALSGILNPSGIAMIHLNSEGQWLPEWHPWPGEKITLQITRPQAVEGQTLTIDSSSLSIKPGQRTQDAELKISLRSSQGSQHTLTLPENAVLQSVAIDGQTQPIRQQGRKLTLPVNPGKQEVFITWQETKAIAMAVTTPLVDLGQDSVNTNLSISLGPGSLGIIRDGTQNGACGFILGRVDCYFYPVFRPWENPADAVKKPALVFIAGGLKPDTDGIGRHRDCVVNAVRLASKPNA